MPGRQLVHRKLKCKGQIWLHKEDKRYRCQTFSGIKGNIMLRVEAFHRMVEGRKYKSSGDVTALDLDELLNQKLKADLGGQHVPILSFFSFRL